MRVLSWQVYAELFNDASPQRMNQLFRYLDKDDTGVVDFLSWSRRIRLQVSCHSLQTAFTLCFVTPQSAHLSMS